MKNAIYIVDITDSRGLLIKSKLEKLKKTVIPLDEAPRNCQRTVVILFPQSKIESDIDFSGSTVFCFKGLEIKNAKIVNLQDNSIFSANNAVLSAEGLIGEIISKTPFSLSSSRVLIVGFGKTGKAIGQMVRNLCRHVYFLTTNPQEFNQAVCLGFDCFSDIDSLSRIKKSGFEIVINTVPVNLIGTGQYAVLNAKYVFDIANVTELSELEDKGIAVVRCPALPARFSPETASDLILDCVLKGE